MNNRIEHIDIAKGISIALVAIFHSKLESFFPTIIEPMSLFRLPLFFFLSGVFFSYSKPPKKFIAEKSESLLKPYFAVLLLVLFIGILSQSENIAWQFKGIFYGNGDTIKWQPMWFLTHLFTVFLFSYILFRFTKFDTLPGYVKWIFLLVTLFFATLYIDTFWYKEIMIFGHALELPGLPFSIDIILVTSVFFISGHLLRDRVTEFSPNIFLLTLSGFSFLCILLFSEAHTDLNKRVYSSPIAGTLGAIFGIYIVMCTSWLLAKYRLPKLIFLSLGGASLYILIFHGFIGRTVYDYTSIAVTSETAQIVLASVAFVLSVSLPLAIKWLVFRNDYLALFFLPFKSNSLLQRA